MMTLIVTRSSESLDRENKREDQRSLTEPFGSIEHRVFSSRSRRSDLSREKYL